LRKKKERYPQKQRIRDKDEYGNKKNVQRLTSLLQDKYRRLNNESEE